MNDNFEFDIYVRYCETDSEGHISNTSYFVYLEEARTRFCESIGYGPKDQRDCDFIIGRVDCDFIAQAYFSQPLKVTTKVERIGSKSYTLSHEIKDSETDLLVASGNAVVVCFNKIKQKSILIPSRLRNVLEEIMYPNDNIPLIIGPLSKSHLMEGGD